MIITCKKCQKKLNISDGDLRPGSAFVCPNCGNRIKAKLADAPQAAQPQWMIRASGEPFGPFSQEQMQLFVSELRIIDAAEVLHPAVTQGSWVAAISIDFLRESLDKNRQPVESPPQMPVPPNGSPSPAPSTNQVEKPKLDYSQMFQSRLRPRSERTVWNFIWNFLDPSFSHFVTPTVIKVTWCALLGIIGLWVLLFALAVPLSLVGSVLPKSSNEREERFQPAEGPLLDITSAILRPVAYVGGTVVVFISLAIGVFFAVLWIRVLLEVCIVIFHVCDHLKSIDKSLKRPSAT